MKVRRLTGLHRWSKGRVLLPVAICFFAAYSIARNIAVETSDLLREQHHEEGDRLLLPTPQHRFEEQSLWDGNNSTNYEVNDGKRIPNILLAGAQKASTSSVANYIKEKLGVCFSDPSFNLMDGKEAHFFDYPRSYRGGLSVYQKKFAYCKANQLILDGTPDTMVYPDRVKKIYDEHGSTKELKVIFILREPVAREISRYNHQLRLAQSPNPATGWGRQILKRNGTIKTFLEDAKVQIFRPLNRKSLGEQKSCYAFHLRRWFELFDRRKQILVLSYDELISNQRRFLHRLHEFLGISESSEMVLPHKNTNKEQTLPPPCQDQLTVARYFEEQNRELYRLLDEHVGPAMEQRPFPKFQTPCQAS